MERGRAQKIMPNIPYVLESAELLEKSQQLFRKASQLIRDSERIIARSRQIMQDIEQCQERTLGQAQGQPTQGETVENCGEYQFKNARKAAPR
jgi:exonuclease VII small subunit